jgi:transcriptional regulator with GAF, ATPase, and Fis domain
VAEGANLRLIDALTNAARDLLATAAAEACVVSRALGDVLIVLTQATADGQTLDFGQGFLVSDYPATARVLRDRAPISLTLDDEQVDAAEAALLHDLGYAALLMLPLDLMGEPWGLVEVYRRAPRHFTQGEITAARERLARF